METFSFDNLIQGYLLKWIAFPWFLASLVEKNLNGFFYFLICLEWLNCFSFDTIFSLFSFFHPVYERLRQILYAYRLNKSLFCCRFCCYCSLFPLKLLLLLKIIIKMVLVLPKAYMCSQQRLLLRVLLGESVKGLEFHFIFECLLETSAIVLSFPS